LAYLILFRHRTHPRKVLAEMFWGNKDPTRSRGSLNTAIWQLRAILEPSGVPRGTYLVGNHPEEIGFNPNSPFWLDVQDFDEGTSQVIVPQPTCIETRLPQLENAIKLYQGDLLEGFYDDWALRERERLRERYLSTLICLMDFYRERGDYGTSLSYGRKILELDPLREEIHRKMITMYLDSGQRAQAARQYETCRDALARELHIEPMEETQSLYKYLALKKSGACPVPKTDLNDELSQALNHLEQAQATFEQAYENLNNFVRTVETLIKSKNP
jgi:DNA-binding SARP family transcriptional activator